MLLAKIGGIAIMIWFFITAKDNNLPAIQWSISGLIGYWLVWWIATLLIASPFMEVLHGNILASQVPAVLAIVAGILIRKKYLLGSIKTD